MSAKRVLSASANRSILHFFLIKLGSTVSFSLFFSSISSPIRFCSHLCTANKCEIIEQFSFNVVFHLLHDSYEFEPLFFFILKCYFLPSLSLFLAVSLLVSICIASGTGSFKLEKPSMSITAACRDLLMIFLTTPYDALRAINLSSPDKMIF